MKEKLKLLLLAMGLIVGSLAFTACGDDDPDEPDVPVNENGDEIVGAFSMNDVDGTMYYIFSEDFTISAIWEDNAAPGYIEEEEEGEWEYVGNRKYIATIDDESIVLTLSRDAKTITFKYDDGETGSMTRCRLSQVPTEERPSASRDALTGTKWKLTAISGFMSDAIGEWRGEILEFGNNGTVLERDGKDGYSGTYTLSGSDLTLNKIPLTYEFGNDFTITKTSSTLKLRNRSNDEITFSKM